MQINANVLRRSHTFDSRIHNAVPGRLSMGYMFGALHNSQARTKTGIYGFRLCAAYGITMKTIISACANGLKERAAQPDGGCVAQKCIKRVVVADESWNSCVAAVRNGHARITK